MTKNLPASVRARLLNVAKAQGVDFNQVLIRFALERILYRMSQSAYADRFLLKGALLFTLWYDGNTALCRAMKNSMRKSSNYCARTTPPINAKAICRTALANAMRVGAAVCCW